MAQAEAGFLDMSLLACQGGGNDQDSSPGQVSWPEVERLVEWGLTARQSAGVALAVLAASLLIGLLQ